MESGDTPGPAPTEPLAAEPSTATVEAALRTVIDPEIGLNLLDLGLIYDTQVSGGTVRVALTLTTPGCPMGAAIFDGVEAALRSLPGVSEVELQLVWEPAWNPDMISEVGRAWLQERR